MNYILDDAGEPVVEPDVLKWAKWFEEFANRRVALDEIGDVRVSTVFLGMDHNFDDKGPPILWETLVGGGPLDEEMDRYTSKASALAGHAAMVERVKNA